MIEYKLVSLQNPDTIVVVTPKGQELQYDNRPPETKTEIVRRFLREPIKVEKRLELRFNLFEYMDYSSDARVDFAYPDLKKYPLWRSVKWQQFIKDDVYGDDVLLWNFVRRELIRMNPRETTTGFYTRSERKKIHLKPMVTVEHDLSTAIIFADLNSTDEPSAPEGCVDPVATKM